MTFKGDTITFECSGRERYAYGCYISLPADPSGDDNPYDKGAVYYGHDGRISEGFGDTDEQRLTPAECAELADHMIARWQAWKALRTKP